MGNQSKEVEFIRTHKLNYNKIAAYIGVHSGTFSEKMNLKRGAKFTQPQLEKLKSYLNELATSISELK